MEVNNSSGDCPVEFLDEVRMPCLICSTNIEIDNVIKHEIINLSEENVDNFAEFPVCVGDNDNIESRAFHSFLKWFGVEVVKKGKRKLIDKGWDGEGGDILRFCKTCKMELIGILDVEKQFDELMRKFDNGLEKVKGKMEESEEAFQSNGIYQKDKRYRLVRSQILKCGKLLICRELIFGVFVGLCD